MELSEVFVTTTQLAGLLNMTPSRARQLCRGVSGKIRAQKVGPLWFIHLTDLLEYVRPPRGRPKGGKNKPRIPKIPTLIVQLTEEEIKILKKYRRKPIISPKKTLDFLDNGCVKSSTATSPTNGIQHDSPRNSGETQ